jgi:hypothetical protein
MDESGGVAKDRTRIKLHIHNKPVFSMHSPGGIPRRNNLEMVKCLVSSPFLYILLLNKELNIFKS